MRIPLFSWLFLIPLFQILLGTDIVLASGQCLDNQRLLLLQLKNTLKFNLTSSTKLVHWNQSLDCCHWSGVLCDKTGRVISLDLDNESITGGIENSSGLFNLECLQSLNLSYNGFNSTQIPSGFSNLIRLTHLNLSNAGFAGQIPDELSHLTTLVSLDLSNLYFPGLRPLKLENPNLTMLVQNLRELTELHLDGVNISAQGLEWCQAISSSLPKLRVLSLSSCYLSGPLDSSLAKLQSLSVIRLIQNNLSAPVPTFFANFTSLTALHLSSCNLQGTFPQSIFEVPTLQILVLSTNGLLQGFLPEFPPNGSLQTLVLSHTNFSGILPHTIGNLQKLSRIDLANCNFSGPIPISLGNLTQLVYLDLSSNKFSGPIQSFSMSKNLTHIDLSRNNLMGGILSTHFEGLLNVVYIDLQFNSFNGTIPSSLFALPSLQKILLFNNSFHGSLMEISHASPSPLDTLDLGGNNLEGHIPSSFFELRRLNVLILSSNNFNGTIQLERFQQLSNLTTLDLSYNNLSIVASGGNSSLSSFPQVTRLKLASCKLQNFPYLHNQTKLSHLDLSDNQIGGKIPNWIWNVGSGFLTHLNLSGNHLEGLQGPYSIPNLIVLDLHSNHLSGEIPSPPQTSIYIDYSNNHFNYSIPADIGNNLAAASFFSVSNNYLTGVIPKSICKAINLQVLDLSNNSLSGMIPSCLIGWSENIRVLNLGRNNLSGKIAGTFLGICGLRTLDLNGNHLEGEVPKSLANCTKLEVLNLGNNKITDKYPCFLKNLSTLRVLVLRSNLFQGGIQCNGANESWPNLQIIDIASNNFTGDLPPQCFLTWRAIRDEEDDAQAKLKHLHFEFLQLNGFYYQDTVTVTNKGQEMRLVKILTIFTSIDFSNNGFTGHIPETIGGLKSLYVLNLSHNALTGPIPPSIGNLKQLESLDLSHNKLIGSIPTELTSLTFLSVLDLSYNMLVGRIPTGRQFQTFTATSYQGNGGLCGFPLNKNCSGMISAPQPSPTSHDSGSSAVTKFDWQFIITGLGYGIGAGIVIAPLMFWKQGRNWCDGRIDELLSLILPAFGRFYTSCDDVKVEAEDNVEEERPDDSSERDEGEDETQDKALKGQYCVFCTKLDIYRRKAVHNPKCTCHGSPPTSSSLSSSSSSSS